MEDGGLSRFAAANNLLVGQRCPIPEIVLLFKRTVD